MILDGPFEDVIMAYNVVHLCVFGQGVAKRTPVRHPQSVRSIALLLQSCQHCIHLFATFPPQGGKSIVLGSCHAALTTTADYCGVARQCGDIISHQRKVGASNDRTEHYRISYLL